MLIIVFLIAVCIAMALFEGVNPESVENAMEVKPTLTLPKVDDEPMSYVIDGVPFEIETPKSKFNKTALKMAVKFKGIEGEIFIGKSLEFQIAVAMKKLKIEPTEKNFKKIIGKQITIWMAHSEKDGNDYYNCSITNYDPVMED